MGQLPNLLQSQFPQCLQASAFQRRFPLNSPALCLPLSSPTRHPFRTSATPGPQHPSACAPFVRDWKPGAQSSSRPQTEPPLQALWSQTPGPQTCETVHFCFNLWHFVTTASGNRSARDVFTNTHVAGPAPVLPVGEFLGLQSTWVSEGNPP